MEGEQRGKGRDAVKEGEREGGGEAETVAVRACMVRARAPSRKGRAGEGRAREGRAGEGRVIAITSRIASRAAGGFRTSRARRGVGDRSDGLD